MERQEPRDIIRVPVMRLVTYDRGGTRRLGAWVGDELVDLPDAVGHPAFPATLEGLVTRSRGTAMEAARAALSNPSYVEEAVVGTPRLLAPLVLAGPDQGAMVGPDRTLSWPEGRVCVWQPEVACVLGRGGRDLTAADAASMIFGYLLAATWTTPKDNGRPGRVRSALGPCVVTADELDLSEVTLTARVNRGVWQQESIGDAASRFARTIARASSKRAVGPGEVFSSPPFDAGHPAPRRLSRDAVVEIEAGPLGVMRYRVRFRRRSETAPRATALNGS